MKGVTHRKITTGTAMIANAKGEVLNFGKVDIRTEREMLNKSFYMLFEEGMKKTGIFVLDYIDYLLKRMNNRNTVIITDEKVAKDMKVCRQTVERVKKKLRDADKLKYSGGIIFINPKWYYRGNAYKREQRLNEYWEFKGIENEKKNTEE